MTGAGLDSCVVTLNAAAPSGGFAVNLTSNSLAITVPASVTVPAGATSGAFTAAISSVDTAQTAMITVSAGGVAEEFSVQLNVGAAGLSINATSIAFGDVPVNTTATEAVELTASGAQPIAITAATVQGTGLSISGVTFPLTLQGGQAATLEVTFNPTTAGATTGQLIIVSAALPSGESVISLVGTGESRAVNLSWNAPNSSADPVAGYNVYRALSGSTFYTQLNSSVLFQTSYVDATIGSGQAYDYIVESVDSAGITSAPSNMASVTVF
jgi:hypothetical protein